MEPPPLSPQWAAAHWEANAEAWTAHARAGYDRYRDLVNTPGFLALLPDVAGLRGIARVGQGHGGLGARMAGLLGRHPRGRAVVVGSDIPAAGAEDILAAFRALGRADAVFGPAADGGYWLVGVGPRRVARPFAGVRWSSEHALSDTLANFAGRRVAFLRTLRDVDTAADLVTSGQCSAAAWSGGR